MSIGRRIERLEALATVTAGRCPTCQTWPDPRVEFRDEDAPCPSAAQQPMPERCPDCGWEPETNIIVRFIDTDIVPAELETS
jgi:hypothetical protein